MVNIVRIYTFSTDWPFIINSTPNHPLPFVGRKYPRPKFCMLDTPLNTSFLTLLFRAPVGRDYGVLNVPVFHSSLPPCNTWSKVLFPVGGNVTYRPPSERRPVFFSPDRDHGHRTEYSGWHTFQQTLEVDGHRPLDTLHRDLTTPLLQGSSGWRGPFPSGDSDL